MTALKRVKDAKSELIVKSLKLKVKERNKIMAKFKMYKNNNRKSTGYNKYYARKASTGNVDLNGLVNHMAGHNTPYSKGVIKGVLEDMVECVRELAYEGKNVKIPNLGIFSVSMKSKGVFDPKEFDPQTDILSRWSVRATGDIRNKTIGVTRAAGAELSWEEVGNYTSPRTAVAETTEP